MQAFISYAHDDYRAFTEFSACLKPVARAFGIDVWADKRLKAGHYWDARIKAAIDASDMYVLLMSTRFLASDYIFDHELPAIEARSRSGALTLPVVLERCYWHAFLGVLQAVPMGDKGRLVPAKDWRPQRDGYCAACEQIAAAISDHFKIAPVSPFRWSGP